MATFRVRCSTLPGACFSPTFFWIFVLISSFLINVVDCTLKATSKQQSASVLNEDNEFAEFEEFEEGSSLTEENSSAGTPIDTKNDKPKPDQSERESITKDTKIADEDDSDGLVEDENEDNLLHLKDDAEFENFDSSNDAKSTTRKPAEEPQQLKITDVPAHLRNNWSNFQVELIMLVGLAIYLANYLVGKAKNHNLATSWFEAHRDILFNNFEVVGDDGTTQEVQKNVLMKESDHIYSLWCTGRPGCQGVLFQLKFLKRQDLISLVTLLFKPQTDKITVRFNLTSDEMDTCVVALGEKKAVSKLVKESIDLSQFCIEKKSSDRLGLPESFSLFAEMAESANAILDSKTLNIIHKYEDAIDYIHASDQYSGLKANEGEVQTKLPETSRVVVFSFNISSGKRSSSETVEELKPLLAFAFYCVEKIRRFRLSREAKSKCDKNRLVAQESYLKQTHAQRQEAAQVRREERVRERKEKVLAEVDPEKQRRLEKVEQKREMKKKQPKVKQLKIKAG